MMAEAFWWAWNAALIVGVGVFVWLSLFFLVGFVMAMLGLNPKWMEEYRKKRQG